MYKIAPIFLLVFLIGTAAYSQNYPCNSGNCLYGGTWGTHFDGGRLTIQTQLNASVTQPEIILTHANDASKGGLVIMNNQRLPDGWRIYHESGDNDLSFRFGTTSSSSWRAVVREPSGEWVSKSDRRFKTDITPISYGLETVMNLNPVRYRFIESTTNEYSLGFIAQEVQPLVNEAVIQQDDEMQSLGMAYSSMIPVLVKAVQEQQAMIDKQQQMIEALVASNQQLMQQMAKMEGSNETTEATASTAAPME